MKQLFRSVWMVALVICCNFQMAFAQQQNPPIPVDPKVRVGKLDNGLTYYIRHNALPEHRAEFYIAQKVGSIQEEPQQRGLAHFLEHMAFNGTKNFPGDETGLGIVQWCEKNGIKFGANLNAYTSIDETVYNISNVPTENPNVVDSCLLILHDWSSAILLRDAEIDKERGVIHEEWRQRNSGAMRIYTEALPILYAGTKYTDCMPIGSIDVIDNFPYQDIRDYYAKWYRPDLQGIIIVGDIDVDTVEAKLKELFADVKAPVNPAERIYYPVNDNEEPLIHVGKDKEITTPSFNIYFKHNALTNEQKGDVGYWLRCYVLQMINSMMNARFSEMAQVADPPFVGAGVSYGNFFMAQTKDAFSLGGRSTVDGLDKAMKAALKEVERMRRYGFTATEYERVRSNFLTKLESVYAERDKSKSGAYVDVYVENFLHGEPMSGIEFEYNTMKSLVPQIPVELINQFAQNQLVTDNNQAVLVMAPEKSACPTNDEIAVMLKGMKSLDVEPYVDKVVSEPLLKEAPVGGKIVSEKSDCMYGSTELVLSNGVKVYIKPTDFKADQIMMFANSWGGSSLFADEEKLNINYLNVVPVGGMGNFSRIELGKALTGKKASLQAQIGGTNETMSGSCSPKDFETFMQLVYLTFTSPRKDAEAFASYKSRLKAQLENAEANPMTAFNDTVSYLMYGNHPRYLDMKPEMVDQIDYDRLIEMFKERYADASDFKFFFVGNVDMEQVKPLIEQYLGALPSINRKETYRDTHMDVPKGVHYKEFAKEQETPKATIFMLYTGKSKFSVKNKLLMSFMSQAMDMVYTEEVREKEGGTYGVSCGGSVSQQPKQTATFQISYQTDPAKVAHLNSIIDAQMQKMITEGPSEEHIQKIKEYMLKTYKDSQKENSYWLNNLNEYYTSGIDYTKNRVELINSITAKDVKKFAAKLIKQNNKITVIMTAPEGAEKAE